MMNATNRQVLRWEIGAYAAVLAIVNLVSLLSGSLESLVFLPGKAAAGEWWRWATHPFVHASWYHLVLDGGAFFLLYGGLVERTAMERTAFVVASAAGALLVSVLAWPSLGLQGLCGLSGVAHGLMAVLAWDMMRSPEATTRRAGAISMALVCGKSLIEALSGHVVFSFMHFGLVGEPVAVCHLGGVLGGLLACVIMAAYRKCFMGDLRTRWVGGVAGLLLGLALVPAVSNAGDVSEDKESVVLLHGLGRTPRSFSGLVRYLEREGFEVVNLGYPSRDKPFRQLAEDVHLRLNEVMSERGSNTVHFVTHSMGGILVRDYLKDREPPNLGRVVMLSPPNQGSEVVDFYEDIELYEIWTGPAGLELGSHSNSVPNLLGPVGFELGVITGNRTVNPILSMVIPGPDDGKVAVDRARVEGMTDFLIVPHSHTFIMTRANVHEQVVHFLRSGTFDHRTASVEGGAEPNP